MTIHDCMEEVKKLGNFGSTVHTLIKNMKIPMVVHETIIDQWNEIDKLCRRHGVLVALYYNLVMCKVPIQHTLTDRQLEEVIVAIVGDVETQVKYEPNVVGVESSGKHLFLKTNHPGSLNKVNLWFTEVVQSIGECDPVFTRDIVGDIYWNLVSMNMSNDQATAVVIQLYALYLNGYHKYFLYISLFRQPEYLKLLTVILKSTGNNSSRYGSMLCEWTALLGRGVAPVNWSEDLSHRIDYAAGQRKTVAISEDRLVESIRRILTIELGDRNVEIEDDYDYWYSRWAWCVNGSHNNTVNDYTPQYCAKTGLIKSFRKDVNSHFGYESRDKLPTRIHRRVYTEERSFWSTDEWDGVSYVTTAEKLEHGKSRALYSVDTLTYFAFNQLLKPIEAAWKNRRVVLDPGGHGSVAMIDKVRNMMQKNRYNVMLDYEDFNSQHSNRTMELVIKTVCEYIGFDAGKAEKLIKSIGNSFIFHGGKCVGRSKSGLHSGHRFTTFMNSILNYVYLDCAYEDFGSIDSLHVGDDVYIAVNSIEKLDQLVTNIMCSGIRMQRLKQSVGCVCAEFLRTAITHNYARGYLARSVASMVSGNWDNVRRLDAVDTLHSLTQQLWTLRNRAGVDMSPVVGRTVKRLYPHEDVLLLRAITRHEVSVDGSPVYGKVANVSAYKTNSLSTYEYVVSYSGYASRDYISHKLKPLELEIIRRMGLTPLNQMMDASYKKSVTSSEGNTVDADEYSIEQVSLTRVSRLAMSEEEQKWYQTGGVISQFPVLVLFKNMLTLRDQRLIVEYLGLDVSDDHLTAACFGQLSRGCVVLSPTPYSDVNYLIGSRYPSCVISSNYPYFL